MSTLMKQISNTEVCSLLNQFSGKKVLLDVRKDNCLYVFNYKQFNWEQDEDYIVLKGEDENEELRLSKGKIIEFSKLDSENIYNEVLELLLKDATIISMCILDEPCRCSKCGRILEKEQEEIWSIKQIGSYYSCCDGETIHKDFCNHCFQGIIK